MKYLPFEYIVYRTDLSEQEVVIRLSSYIETKKNHFVFKNKSIKEYEGFINGKNFEINRIIKSRNSFLPQISGSIHQNNYQTQIKVEMKLHWSVMIFLILWCLFIFFSLIFIERKIVTFDSFIPFLMLIFAYFLTMYGFKSESKKSKEDLKKIFEAEYTRK
jgi:hypothetical protein